jgi:hypothetical protein
MSRRLILGLLVGWAAAGFLFEVNEAVTGYDGRQQASALPWLWRFGLPEPARLERCVAAARRAIAPGAAVAFATPDEPLGAAFTRWRWAAYLMPAEDVIPANDPAAARLAEYAIACGTRIEDPSLAPLRDLPDGRLYRVQRP